MRGLTSLLSTLLLLASQVVLVQGQELQVGAAIAPVSGDAYLLEVLKSMERRSNLSARLRYQSRLRDEPQVGSGSYWQQWIGPQRLTHWEMQTKVGKDTASYVQVFDGRYVWTDSHTPRERKVRRLDVANLENRLRVASWSTGSSAQQKAAESAAFRGGLPQLLAELSTRYEFSTPHATQLNGFAVKAVLGRWRKTQLAQLSSTADAEAPTLSTWPTQIPHHVLLLVGDSNDFPYVVEFRRVEDAYLLDTVAGLKPARDPILRYEIFEVSFTDAIDPAVFAFRPGDIEWSDETSVVFDKLQAQRHPPAEIADRQKQAEGQITKK